MFRKDVLFNNYTASAGEGWSSLLLQGLILILFGVMILVVPQLLVALVAFFFMALGALLLWFAYLNRKAVRHSYRFSNFFWDDF